MTRQVKNEVLPPPPPPPPLPLYYSHTRHTCLSCSLLDSLTANPSEAARAQLDWTMSFFKGDAAKTNAPSFFGAGSAKNSGTSASQSTSAFSQVSQSMTSFLSNFPPEIYKKCQSSYSSNSNNEEEDIESMATDDNDDVLSDSDSVESDTRDNLDDFDDSYNPRHDQQATEEVQVNDETQDIHKTEDSQSPFPTDTSSSNVDMRAPTSLSSTPVPIQAAKIDNFAIPGTPMRRPRITTTTTSRLRVMPLPNPSLKKSDAVEHTIKPKETLNPVVAMNQIIVSPPSQRRVMNRKSKNGKDDELQQQQHQQQQQQKQHYLQHQVELPAEREQQRKEHCVTDARSADLSHDHHSHIGNQEACSHQHSQYCVDPKDADGTRSSDSGSSSSRSGGSSRQQHVTLQSSRASDLSFDHLQQKLGDLEMAIKTGKLAVVREREGIGEKEQELCLQKNRLLQTDVLFYATITQAQLQKRMDIIRDQLTAFEAIEVGADEAAASLSLTAPSLASPQVDNDSTPAMDSLVTVTNPPFDISKL